MLVVALRPPSVPVLTLLALHRRRAEVCAELERRPHGEWVRRLGDADVPVSPVQDYADVADSEQLAVNGYVKQQEVIDKGDGKSFGMRLLRTIMIATYPHSF